MTSRLDRHERIAALRAKRAAVEDAEVLDCVAAVDASGIVEALTPLVRRTCGRPRTLGVRALFVGLALCSARHRGEVVLSTVTDLLTFAITDTMRDRLGIPRYPDHDRGFEAAYAVVRRLFHACLATLDPSPVPKNTRLETAHADRLRAEADTAALTEKRTLLIKIANLILGMSLRGAHPLLAESWDGSCVVDATVIGTYARGLAADSPVTSTDPDAGWYRRDSRHQDPQALDALAPPPSQPAGSPRPGRGTSASAKKKKEKKKLKKALFGYDATLVVARDPRHDGTPLPDGSGNPDVIPALVAAFSVDRPGHRPGQVAVEALCHVDPRYPCGFLAADRLYNDQKIENYQLPIRAMGYLPVYDYAKDQLGVQAGSLGAILVEGSWYCPSMPEPLVNATKDLLAKRIDKGTWINLVNARTDYLLKPKQAADSEGHRRMMCPAEAGRVQCPLKIYTLGRGIHLPLVDPEPNPAGPPKICAKRSVTIAPETGAAQWQALQYGTEEWQKVYFRLRNAIEAINGYAKDPLYERLEAAGTRRIRGIAAQTILLAFQLAHANIRKLATWAQSVALNGERPHRRPTRRRETKPLGFWTPVGYDIPT